MNCIFKTLRKSTLFRDTLLPELVDELMSSLTDPLVGQMPSKALTFL